ncbi:XRE family transcriptional regulator [Oceanospirillaceae bacterium]|uniref:helix-turn-helix domain-containing protein n=1 Tax=Candidatus Njordibacter sp. Uisw_002 TaxID=3230971 RepID=UPI002338EA58|nr:XRE family transcriptional regulator [Oceanospirillaceae bacterium]MDB9957925.1 XRE family transcriptional regulator [Oceanospirillaceae bacterium]
MSTLRPEAGILPPVPNPALQQGNFGERLRALRQDRKMTLQQASKVTGVAQSTLSKMENNQLSPTFNLMQKLALGLGIDMPQLFAPVKEVRISGRRSVTKKQQGREHLTATYEHELLATELDSKRMVPFKSRVRARTLEEFGGWVRHEGEELLLVLEGDVVVYTEEYEPLALTEGDSTYFDSTMGHAVVSTSKGDALILWVCVAT